MLIEFKIKNKILLSLSLSPTDMTYDLHLVNWVVNLLKTRPSQSKFLPDSLASLLLTSKSPYLIKIDAIPDLMGYGEMFDDQTGRQVREYTKLLLFGAGLINTMELITPVSEDEFCDSRPRVQLSVTPKALTWHGSPDVIMTFQDDNNVLIEMPVLKTEEIKKDPSATCRWVPTVECYLKSMTLQEAVDFFNLLTEAKKDGAEYLASKTESKKIKILI